MSLFSALDIGSSGLAAQRLRVELLAQNIANAQTTRTPEGGPYRRRHAVFESDPSLTFGVFGRAVPGRASASGRPNEPRGTVAGF